MTTIINADTSNGLKLTSDTSGEIELQSAGVTKVTMDTSGNVGIGTSSPARPLEVKQSGDSFISITAGNANSSVLELGDSDDINIGRILYNHSSNYLATYTNNAERMRIQSSGDVLVGTTTDIAAGSEGVEIKGNFGYIVTARNATSAASHHLFFNPNGIVGSIQTSGTSTSYVTSSDYRLKENVAPMSGSIDRLKQLKPSTWAWVQDGSHGEGFLAHEAQTVIPASVTGTKDAMRTEEYEVTPAVLDDDGNVVTRAIRGTREVPDYQGIDQSKLVPLLTAALQEAITKIEDLEARIQALENA